MFLFQLSHSKGCIYLEPNFSLLYLCLEQPHVSLNLSLQNEKALAKADDGTHHALLKDADKHCKVILRRLSHGHGCMKSMAFVSVVLAVGAIFMSQNMHFLDYNKLSELLNLSQVDKVACPLAYSLALLMPGMNHPVYDEV